jgi:hypothetical protein
METKLHQNDHQFFFTPDIKDETNIQTQNRPEMKTSRSKSTYTSQFWQSYLPYYSLACGGYTVKVEGDTSKGCQNI